MITLSTFRSFQGMSALDIMNKLHAEAEPRKFQRLAPKAEGDLVVGQASEVTARWCSVLRDLRNLRKDEREEISDEEDQFLCKVTAAVTAVRNLSLHSDCGGATAKILRGDEIHVFKGGVLVARKSN